MEQRLDTLERRSMLLAIIVLAQTIALLIILTTFGIDRPKNQIEANKVFNTLKVKDIEVEDIIVVGSGTGRVTIAPGVIRLRSAMGSSSLAMISAETSGLLLLDNQDVPRMYLGITKKNTTSLEICDKNGKLRTVLGCTVTGNQDGPTFSFPESNLAFFNSSGSVIYQIPKVEYRVPNSNSLQEP